jgi:hypothetical protein
MGWGTFTLQLQPTESNKRRIKHYGRQQGSVTAKATTTAAKHPPEPWRQSIRQNYGHRRGKASVGGAITLTATKHLHGRGPWRLHGSKAYARNSYHRHGKASADGADTLSTVKHL